MGLLNISDLKVHFETDDGIVRANDIIQLEIQENEIIGLIGETGCGKTILGHAMVRLLPDNAKVSGNICYKNKNLLKLTENEMRQIRGNEIAIIFQNPYLSLNPVLTIEEQIAEIYQYRLGIKEGEIKGKVSEVLEMVSVDPGRKAEYPHQFSGGMIQRVMIAMAIVFNPEFLIADEITKGLDTPV